MTENAHLDHSRNQRSPLKKRKDLINNSCTSMCFVINNCTNHSAWYKPSNTL